MHFDQACSLSKVSKSRFSHTIKHTGAIFITFTVTVPFEEQLFQVTPPSSVPS